MEAFAGFEPQVGEIRALRTFRIGPGGVLYPLFSSVAWTTGTNSCRCRLTKSVDALAAGPQPHPAPYPDCGCGFYAYGDPAAAAEYAQSQHVLAVIAGWGRVIAGTRGIRCEHARIEALWLSARVPDELIADVAVRYPASPIYRDQATMLAEHPPTQLDCYDIPPDGHGSVRHRLVKGAVVAALALGALPANWIWRNDNARLVWAIELGFFAFVALFLRLSRTDRQSRGSALFYAAVTLWLIAPFAGGAGIVLLRLPILQIAVLGRIHRARLNREAGRFPAAISDP